MQFRDCVGEYERYLLMIDNERTMCLQSANQPSPAGYWVTMGARLACEIEFTARTQAGIWQFLACMATPKIG